MRSQKGSEVRAMTTRSKSLTRFWSPRAKEPNSRIRSGSRLVTIAFTSSASVRSSLEPLKLHAREATGASGEGRDGV